MIWICLALVISSFVGFLIGNYYVYSMLHRQAYLRAVARRERYIKDQVNNMDREYEDLIVGDW